MKLIEADKVKRVMKDYWKAQVDKALTLTFTDGNEANKRINSYLEHNHELLKAIDELPSIQPERKTGHWVKSDMQRWYDVWLCSECGEKTDSSVMSKPRYKYCPMCGAKMEGGDE
jgi:rubrerythrin